MISNINRICILGLPRSGSQYTVELIKATFPKLEDLVEPFTLSAAHDSLYCVNKRVVTLPKNLGFDNLADQTDQVISVLKQGSIDQPLILRLFLTNEFAEFFPSVINELHQLNFRFLILKRENIEHHLLSFAIAATSNKWNSRQGIHTATDKIFVENLGNMEWLYRSILNFNWSISQLSYDYDIIRYEHAVEDLEKALGYPINAKVQLKKQITTDPYAIIENADQVRNYIKELII